MLSWIRSNVTPLAAAGSLRFVDGGDELATGIEVLPAFGHTPGHDVVPYNTRFPGMGGVQGFYASANAAVPDFKIHVWGEYDAPGCSIREVTISGTHIGDWCGVPGTCRQVRIQLAGLFLFGSGEQAGRILAERIYFDNDTVMRPIRGEMEASSVMEFPLPEMTGVPSAD